MEKFIDRPRHIEMQILGDGRGGVLHFGERECSLQRRHQKVVEEAPSLWMTPERREAMGEAATRLTSAVRYRNAGTIEFIADNSGAFYFLEMNTRLQVEHPVTELVYGVDLVREQIRMARGEPLPRAQRDVTPMGWALECRLYAEDPYNRFLPSLGVIQRLRLGTGPGIRNDMGIFQGYEVPRFYDPMLGKIIAHGPDRETARRRMLLALRETVVEGIRTNIAFHRWVLKRDEFIEGDLDTHFIERVFTGNERPKDPERERAAIIASVIQAYETDHSFRPPRNESRSRWRWLGRPGAVERERG
jgi:acetyl/propionyl-CoA carboxylase alpha subunit